MRLFLLAALLLAMGIHGESKKPNIVLILIDDLGLTDLQAFGGEIDTPNMDALANEGMMFTNYHTTSECARTLRCGVIIGKHHPLIC